MLGGFLVLQESPGRCTKRLVVRGSSGSSHCPQLLDLFLSELLSFHRADGLLLLLLPPPTPVPSFAEDFQKLAVFPVSIGFPAFLVVLKVNGVHLNYIVATQDKGRNLPGSHKSFRLLRSCSWMSRFPHIHPQNRGNNYISS